MDMIEKVARALASDLEEGFPRFTQMRWDQLTVPAKAKFMQRARVAIEAMREPTHQMLYEGVGYSDWVLPEAIGATKEDYLREMRCGWVSMIDAALKPSSSPGQP